MRQALLAGALAAVVSAVVGTWVVLRGLAFMGDALAHGVLPGIAVAYLVGFDLLLGAAIAAVVVVAGVTLVSSRARLREDTGIGLLFVGMLALGVLVISRAGSFAVDLTAFLFGDVLGVTSGDVRVLAVAAIVVVGLSVVGYRPFLVLAFNERKAATLGLRPRLAQAVLLGMVALAVVASFRAVGTLLVFGLLIGPPATASLLTRRLPTMMVVSVLVGWSAVVGGLLLSWHLALAAGAAISALAVAEFFAVLAVQECARWWRGRHTTTP